ncbi:uncharacterized protein EI90DRAFT_3291884 [Cantharellus anzutake]|uniref:uncharacterized protein n=1 Tax=Cantharellus anzutake TaxID=1750568 RepID=UPI001905854A|nr:uncharacterized protein EI90DRAFT_3291884 [Cantharellus anzutake]KAF8325051.1 hypothetical protein EI90DRAFT_3291884 [Cantharellus anzutake]
MVEGWAALLLPSNPGSLACPRMAVHTWGPLVGSCNPASIIGNPAPSHSSLLFVMALRANFEIHWGEGTSYVLQLSISTRFIFPSFCASDAPWDHDTLAHGDQSIIPQACPLPKKTVALVENEVEYSGKGLQKRHDKYAVQDKRKVRFTAIAHNTEARKPKELGPGKN